MSTLLYIVVFAIIVILIIRFYPADTEAFHEDPADPDPQRAEVRLIGLDAPRFPATASEVLEAFANIATSDPGVRIVEGDIEEGMMTFMSRSKILGLRDFITVKAVDEVGAAKLAILARPRIKAVDWTGNGDRLDRWLQEMSHTFGG